MAGSSAESREESGCSSAESRGEWLVAQLRVAERVAGSSAESREESGCSSAESRGEWLVAQLRVAERVAGSSAESRGEWLVPQLRVAGRVADHCTGVRRCENLLKCALFKERNIAHALWCGLRNSTLRSGNSRMRFSVDRVIVQCGPVIRACA